MTYSHGIKWTDELIESEIKRVMDSLGIERMPSKTEIECVTKDSKLTNKISKSGGFYKWAEKLGIDVKKSETEFAVQYESLCKNHIENELGLIAELTPVKFPYDILVGVGTKIDVKVSRLYCGSKGSFFTSNLTYKLPKSDFIVMYCIDDLYEKVYVIPSTKLIGINQLSIGEVTSKYDKFLGRWDLIKRFDELLGIFKSSF